MTQINPPFDGSKPCPMCSVDVRNISAMIHNMLNRWPDSRAFVKLSELRHYARPVATVPHPAVTELLDCFDLLKSACADMKEDGLNISWTTETTKKLLEIMPRVRLASAEIEKLSDLHFDDDRHSSGDDNYLRERQGYDRLRSHYHYTVDVVVEGGDIQHNVCGARLKLHDHFKSRMALDPLFYGKVWCPACRTNVPFAQFHRC